MMMPFYIASSHRKGYFTVSPYLEHAEYVTILDVPYAKVDRARFATVPALRRLTGDAFSRMVKTCLGQQLQGELTGEMLNVLIDFVELLKPHERLLLLLLDLETYRDLQTLNGLLAAGRDASRGAQGDRQATEAAIAKAREEALEMIDDLLFTDYHQVVNTDERGNIH